MSIITTGIICIAFFFGGIGFIVWLAKKAAPKEGKKIKNPLLRNK